MFKRRKAQGKAGGHPKVREPLWSERKVGAQTACRCKNTVAQVDEIRATSAPAQTEFWEQLEPHTHRGRYQLRWRSTRLALRTRHRCRGNEVAGERVCRASDGHRSN